jgi:hypothetical protein
MAKAEPQIIVALSASGEAQNANILDDLVFSGTLPQNL